MGSWVWRLGFGRGTGQARCLCHCPVAGCQTLDARLPIQNVKDHRPHGWPVVSRGPMQIVADCKVWPTAKSPDGVRIACEIEKSLLSGRIEIQGVPKFCFLENPVSGWFSPHGRTEPPEGLRHGKHS